MKKLILFGAITLSTAIFAQLPNYVPTNGLVGWWPFTGNANDLSGNGFNGTVNGATLTTDRFGNVDNAYEFNDSYIEVQPVIALNGATNYTWGAWIKLDNAAINGQNYVICRGWDYSNGFNLWVNHSAFTQIINGFNSFIKTSSQQPIVGDWHHILVTRNASTLSYYYDGELDTTHSYSSALASNNELLYFGVHKWIGQQPGYFPYYFKGKIDDIGIWNRALTQQEITDLYNGCQLSVNTQPSNQTINVNNNAQFVVSSPDPSATYQWQTDLGVGYQNLNSVGQYSGTTTNTLTVSNLTMSNNNQPFRCIVSSGSCSDTSNVAVLTVNNNVGINETSQDKLFAIFPNPAQSVINVKSDGKLIGSVYSIYNNTGKVVLSGKLNAESTTIELGNLSGGVYMFSVGENMKQTFKVIKE